MSITRRGLGLLAAAAATVPALGAPGPGWAQEDIPNIFISPHGEPFRGGLDTPYPVVEWFRRVDKNADGKIDRAEFLADAEVFFAVLDKNKDGQLDPYEVSLYEHVIAPEIIGMRYHADAGPARAGGARLWRAQYTGGGPGSGQPMGPPGGIVPSGETPNEPRVRQPNTWELQGASPYSILPIPEPVTSTDPDFMFRGRVRKDRFLAASGARFSALDFDNKGFLTLDALPRTAVQDIVDKAQRRGRRR
jgi:hypothetical protein